MNWLGSLVVAACGVSTLAAETIHLKTRDFEPRPDRTEYMASPLKRRTAGSSHYLIQLDGGVRPETFRMLRHRGITVTGYLPKSTLMIAAPDDFSFDSLPAVWVSRLELRDKISPLVVAQAGSTRELGAYIVEFHSDVDMKEAHAMVREHGLRLIENSDLARHHLLVNGTIGDLSRLASWDEVAYIFPASPELISHTAVRACAGAVVQETAVAQAAGNAYSWPVSGSGGLVLGYVFSQVTEKLPAAAAQSEILRAFNEWSKVAQVSFVSGTSAQALRTVNILFAHGAHGDAFAFDGPGGVLAHTFYPAPPNPEPIAGDMHLDNDERWQVGANTDLYTVVLHEAGHATGLVHTDNPNDVMYPYYRLGKQLEQWRHWDRAVALWGAHHDFGAIAGAKAATNAASSTNGDNRVLGSTLWNGNRRHRRGAGHVEHAQRSGRLRNGLVQLGGYDSPRHGHKRYQHHRNRRGRPRGDSTDVGSAPAGSAAPNAISLAESTPTGFD